MQGGGYSAVTDYSGFIGSADFVPDIVSLAVDSMINVMRRVRASVILPMHWFTDRTLERFLQGMEAEGFAMERARTNEVEVSLRALPERPTVIALRPAWLRDTE